MPTLIAENLTITEINTKLTTLYNAGGGTLILPAGEETYTAAIGPMLGNILQGAGNAATILNLDGGEIDYFAHPAGMKDLRINLLSGSKMIESGYAIENGPIAIYKRVIFNSEMGFTTTHNFIQTQNTGGHPHAVFSECVFNSCRILVIGNNNDPGTAGHIIRWSEDSVIGTGAGHIIIEDCTFSAPEINSGNHIDGNRGSKVQIRYCTFTNRTIEQHSVQQEANRGVRSWEIYNCTMHTEGAALTPFFIRAGTGVIYNNNYTGPWTAQGGAFDNIRSWADHTYPPGQGDGSSDWDQNTVGEEGWRLRDQIGTGKDNVGSFPTVGQAADPAYLWNNKYEGTATTVSVVNNGNDVKVGGSSADIQEGRDYYEDTIKPGYSAFTYPHPAVAEESTIVLLGACLS